jgi:hypothetical protein
MDVPGVLIILGTVAYLAWAIYNWTHRDAGMHK